MECGGLPPLLRSKREASASAVFLLLGARVSSWARVFCGRREKDLNLNVAEQRYAPGLIGGEGF
jgi:hypothetical protein